MEGRNLVANVGAGILCHKVNAEAQRRKRQSMRFVLFRDGLVVRIFCPSAATDSEKFLLPTADWLLPTYFCSSQAWTGAPLEKS